MTTRPNSISKRWEEKALTEHTIRTESLDSYKVLWHRTQHELEWNCLFVLPIWLETMRRHLGGDGDPLIVTIAQGDRLVGIAPLVLNGSVARFLGSPEVCDYQDIVAAPGQAETVMMVLVDYLKSKAVKELDLRTLRPDAAAFQALSSLEVRLGWTIRRSTDDVTFEARLPLDWEAYLHQINGKQRHEIRRKQRRLEGHGPFAFRLAGNNGQLEHWISSFLHLFRSNRPDKASFMNGAMENYFRDLMKTLDEHRLLRLYFLEIDNRPTAAVFCIDYHGVRYLYNSGYDVQYEPFSVGVLSKVFSIRQGIENGCLKFDFLKGAEAYKRHIGGIQVPLHRCTIQL